MNSLAPKNSLNLAPPARVIISGTDIVQKIGLKRWDYGHDRVDCYVNGPPVCTQHELEQQQEE